MRSSTNRSPIDAMTAWWVSHAVVTAPMTAMRPSHGMVRPPSAPTLRDPAAVVDLAQRGEHLRRACLWSIDRIDVTSLMTSRPREPSLRSSPPVASLARSRLAVAGQQRGF